MEYGEYLNYTNSITREKGFQEFQNEYRAAIKFIETKIEVLSDDFALHYEYNPIHHVERRLKVPASIEEKLERLRLEVSIDSARENLFDIAGIRIVCNFIEDVYEVANMLTSQDDIKVVTHKDYIRNRKPNGYASLHLVLMVPVYLLDGYKEVPVEVQIRTVAMDFWASLEHQIRYKKGYVITDDMNDALKACAEDSAKLDERMQEIFSAVYRKNNK